MERKVIMETPLYTLRSSDYNDCADLDIYRSDLEKAKVGDVFEPELYSNCGRAKDVERMTIIYRDTCGVAGIVHHECSTDSPNPRDYYPEPELVWFELHH